MSKRTKIPPIYNKELNLIFLLLSYDISVIWDKRDISYNNDIRYIWDISDIRHISDNQDKSVLMWRSDNPI